MWTNVLSRGWGWRGGWWSTGAVLLALTGACADEQPSMETGAATYAMPPGMPAGGQGPASDAPPGMPNAMGDPPEMPTGMNTGGQAPTTAPPGPQPDGMLADSAMPMAMPDAGEPEAATPERDGAMPPEREDLGEGDGSDVITIGDSWMDYFLSGGGIEAALARAGKDYRNYSLSGTRFLNGVIPRQYDTAKSRDPNIVTVIMTGGGNDILLGGYDCDTAASCQEFVEDLTAGLNELWTKMSDDGVKDVVYINYSSDAGSSPADTRPMQRPVPQICITGPIRCHSVATTDLVDGDLLDGIHPTRAANDRIAAAVLELMEREGVRR